MIRIVILVLVMVALPIAALFTAPLGERVMQYGEGSTVMVLGGAKTKLIHNLAGLCQSSPMWSMDYPEACSDLRTARLVRLGAWGAISVGLLLLAAIAVTGWAARSRPVLLLLFTPGLRLTINVLCLLLLTHAALLVGMVYLLLPRVPIHLIGFVASGALYVTGAMRHTALGIARQVACQTDGRPLSREEYPAVWALVERIAGRLGTAPPDHILAGLAPNFFVTEMSVNYPGGLLSGRTLYLSLPFCRIVSTKELEAITGHELAHFRGADTAYSRHFYPVYRGLHEAIALLDSRPGDWLTFLFLPVRHTLRFFLASFATAERAVSREREFLADRAGAEAAGISPMATALVKLHAFGEVWERVLEWLARRGELDNASYLFAVLVLNRADWQALSGLDEQELPHPLDSHPPLRQRLDALGANRRQVHTGALDVAPDEPASELFANRDSLEVALTWELRGA